MGNNNGSAFAGLQGEQAFYNILGGLAMLASRFWLAIPVLAIAGALAAKKPVPAEPGHAADPHATVRGPARSAMVILVGALTFIPALALGPDRRAAPEPGRSDLLDR